MRKCQDDFFEREDVETRNDGELETQDLGSETDGIE